VLNPGFEYWLWKMFLCTFSLFWPVSRCQGGLYGEKIHIWERETKTEKQMEIN